MPERGTAAALFRLLAWTSPSFPVGAFSYSHGLEWAVASDGITSEAALAGWLGDLLDHGTGWSDAVILAAAHRAAADDAALAELAELAASLAAGRERWLESVQQGAAFRLAVMTGWCAPSLADLPDPLPYPVAVGAAAARHGIALDLALPAYLHGLLANLISAGVRLIPLGQSAGLRLLAGLEGPITALAARAAAAGLEDLGQSCFAADLAALSHETQHTRLFRT